MKEKTKVKSLNNFKKQVKGITLIALVVTIALLILSTVSISMLVGENGIISQAIEDAKKQKLSEDEEIKNLNAMNDLMNNKFDLKNVKVGWNLGNSLDCTVERTDFTVEEFETYWNNPVTTKEMIIKIKETGFDTILIPVTWFNHVNQENKIDSNWMKRVTEVVNYAMDINMNVIINTHHDDERLGLEKEGEEFETYIQKYCTIWEQIANNFKDYNHNLMFEILNEPTAVVDGERLWSTDNKSYYDNLNNLSNELLKTIRNTGGKNSNRYVLIPTYGTQITEEALNYITVPNDKNIAVFVHGYIPYSYCSDESKELTESDIRSIESGIKSIVKLREKHNVPVLITEMGCVDKESKEDWTKMMCLYAFQNKIPVMFWDSGKTYTLFDRRTLKITDTKSVEIMKKAYEVIENIDKENNNIIETINYTKNVEYNDVDGMNIIEKDGKNHYTINSNISESVRFKFEEIYFLNNEGIYEFSCKIKTPMNALDAKYVLNFYGENNVLIYQKNYESLTSNLVDGNKEIYEYKTFVPVDGAYKVQLERIHISCKVQQNINCEIYDISLRALEL